MAQEGNGTGTVLLAFLLGAAAGAAVALLFAPAAGKETREYLGERAREGKEKATDAARQARETVSRQRENLGAAIERGRQAYREAKGEEQA